jgi:(R,R)-butanediol dehydrogenase/meso-butanediol dehydrogenase/diacetyl reductase
MKAAVFKGPNQMAVAEVAKPQAGPNEVVLKVHACGICGSDLHAVQYGIGMPPDTVMGHEFCGEIHQLGPGVGGFRIGERVTSLPYISCGKCENCRAGNGIRCTSIQSLGLGQLPGAYAEYVRCGADSLLKLPDNVSSREGAMVEPLSVGLHGVYRAGFRPGTACVVMGAGPVGLATLLWCKAKGAQAVVISELAPGRADLACGRRRRPGSAQSR